MKRWSACAVLRRGVRRRVVLGGDARRTVVSWRGHRKVLSPGCRALLFVFGVFFLGLGLVFWWAAAARFGK